VERRLLWLNVGVKALLVAMLLLSVTSDLERFNGRRCWRALSRTPSRR
jgi:hypothetical protein